MLSVDIDGIFDSWFAANLRSVVSDLVELLSIPTVSPQERLAHDWLATRFSSAGLRAELVGSPAALVRHQAYVAASNFVPGADTLPSTLRFHDVSPDADKPTILFNGHVDVVPADSAGFSPAVNGNIVTGRGAADTKNNIIMLLTALRFIRAQAIRRQVNVVVDLVDREEVGGSGTLSSILSPPKESITAVVVLEPTSLIPQAGHRGCLSVEVEILGESVHMGSAASGLDAIRGGIRFIELLRVLEAELLQDATRHPVFANVPRPVQVNVGYIRGGQWHGSLAERCVIGANLGFVPPRTSRSLEGTIEDLAGLVELGFTKDRFKFRYNGLRNEAYVPDLASETVQGLLRALSRETANEPSASWRAWEVSCDAHLYDSLTGLPTIVYGSGDLSQAHSRHESVDVEEIGRGARTLARLMAGAAGAAGAWPVP